MTKVITPHTSKDEVIQYSYIEIRCGQVRFEDYVLPSAAFEIECFAKTNCISSGKQSSIFK